MRSPAWARPVDTFCPERFVSEAFLTPQPQTAGRLWAVGPLMRAVADALANRFNPVAIRGEVTGFARAASGHCYFSLKDDSGQLRCAMFRRSAEQLTFEPRDGQVVQAQGKLDVYGPRGDLQLIVDRLTPDGQGALFERFLRLKAQLEAEGLFDASRKRSLPAQPRSIGVVTSLGAAALRDVVTTLRRRVPHLPVLIFPASVQGASAAGELCAALQTAYQRHGATGESDVLLLVRGGGSLEDLWSFNDEALVRTVAQAPMPVVCGVGHETDFTLADFVADLRAPTPTAAAELCAPSRESRLGELMHLSTLLEAATFSDLDQRAQRLDRLAQRLGRPSARLHGSRQTLLGLQHSLQSVTLISAQGHRHALQAWQTALPLALRRAIEREAQRLRTNEAALKLLDPRLVLERGYAFLTDDHGHAITRVAQARPGQGVRAHLADGEVDLTVNR
jgi:exodeoxyribonuclease VII large subunit